MSTAPITDAAFFRRVNHPAWTLLLLPVTVIVVGLSVSLSPLWGHRGGYIDLEVYRLGVQAWQHGKDLYGHLPDTTRGISLPFIYPPFAALALGGFAAVPWAVSVGAYLVCSVGALAVTLHLVARHFWPTTSWYGPASFVTACATPLALFLEPVKATLDFGQVNLILMALVAADCLTRKPAWPRGILVGIAAAIKLTPAAFVLYFLIRRDYRAAALAAGSGAVCTAVAFVLLPHESMRYWFGGFGNIDGLSGSAYQTNQSFQAVLSRFAIEKPASTVLWLVLTAALVSLAVVLIRRPETPASIAFSVNAVVALLVSPISWSHHWVWVAPALLAMIGWAGQLGFRQASGRYVTAGLTAVVFVVAPHHFLPGQHNREVSWTLPQQFIGNTYVWFSVALLVALLCSNKHQAHGPAADAPPETTQPEPELVAAQES